MKIGPILAASLVLMALTSCAAWKEYQAQDQFDKSSREYNQMIRWQEREAAGNAYADKGIREEFLARAEAAKEVKVTDYRVKAIECDPVRGEATVKVEIDYYVPPSVTVKTLVDNQKWSYLGIEGNKTWRLMTLLPEFK